MSAERKKVNTKCAALVARHCFHICSNVCSVFQKHVVRRVSMVTMCAPVCVDVCIIWHVLGRHILLLWLVLLVLTLPLCQLRLRKLAEKCNKVADALMSCKFVSDYITGLRKYAEELTAGKARGLQCHLAYQHILLY